MVSVARTPPGCAVRFTRFTRPLKTAVQNPLIVCSPDSGLEIAVLKQAFPPALLFCLPHPGSRPHGDPQGPHRQQLGGRTLSSASPLLPSSSASQVHLTSYLLSCPVTTARFHPDHSPPTPTPQAGSCSGFFGTTLWP